MAFRTRPGRIWRFRFWRELGTEHNLVVSSIGSELLFRNLPGILRVHVTDAESRRIGNLMVDRRLEREEAKALLATPGSGTDVRAETSFWAGERAF